MLASIAFDPRADLFQELLASKDESALDFFERGLLITRADRFLHVAPAIARRALISGALLLGGQNLVMALAIRFSGDATAVNIIYSSRCVLSVVLAWATARWLGSREATLPRHVLLLRLAGAALLAGAIAMVVL